VSAGGLNRKLVLAGAGIVAAILALVALPPLFRALSPRDPRAYPGSGITSLEEVYEIYHLRLPDCAESTVRHGKYGQLTVDTLYLHFSGDGECISRFLSVNNLAAEQMVEVFGLPFNPSGTEFGWPQDETREYQALRGTLSSPEAPSLVDVVVAIDYGQSPHGLYLQAGIL
jgi:hypothetical protein